MGIFQDCQQKLFEEIQSVVPDLEADINQADLANMPYLDAFVKESLRFFPVVPVLTRLLKEDMQLGGALIPKGTEYVMDIWNMHRAAENWKFDAKKFNPENFFPQNVVQRHPYSYIPYSAGPRNCIGNAYNIYNNKKKQQIIIQTQLIYIAVFAPYLHSIRRHEICKYLIEATHCLYRSSISY